MTHVKRIMPSEIERSERHIDMIVIHCSGTREDRRYVLSQLDRDHRARGFHGIGYHFYITKEGRTYQTRHLDIAGAHAKGHNYRSIGICYEGGLDAHNNPKDTRTLEQRISLQSLIDRLIYLHGHIRVVGHKELNPHKACPSFDVQREYNRSMFH